MRVVENSFPDLQAFTGQRNCFQLPWLHQGFLQKVIVKQSGGPLQDFTVNVFNSQNPCEGGGSQSLGGENAYGKPRLDPDLYKVLPTFTGLAGEAMMQISDVGWTFRNQDGDESHPQYYIYVEITPTGQNVGGVDTTEPDGAITVWQVVVSGWTDVR